MKFVVYYDQALFGVDLKTKPGKALKTNVELVLGNENVIWIPSERTSVEFLAHFVAS